MSGDRRTQTQRRVMASGASCCALAVAACAVAAVTDPATFYPGYLVAVLWVWSLSIGGIALGLVFHLTGGRWGEAGRGWFEVAARAMPIVTLLFIPLAFGLSSLYPWTKSDYFEGMLRVEHRKWYYGTNFFLLRGAVYLAIWNVLGLLVGGVPGIRRNRTGPLPGGSATAGIGAIILLMSVTWAAIDWLMSFDPHYTSTLFGGLIGGGAMLTAMAFVVAGVMITPNRLGASDANEETPVSDLGNLMLAMLMLWAYLSFSQFLLQWAGNLPEAAKYYAARSSGGWQVIPISLAIFGFAIPLAALTSTRFKKSPRLLGVLALWMLFVRLLELDWFVLPHFSPGEFAWNWVACVAPIATGGIMLAYVAWDVPLRLRETAKEESDG